MSDKQASIMPAVLLVLGDNGEPLFGLRGRERLVEQFARLGIPALDQSEPLLEAADIIIARSDVVIDQPLVQALSGAVHVVLLDELSRRPVALRCAWEDRAKAQDVLNRLQPITALDIPAREPSQMQANYWGKLRKRETPYALFVDRQNADATAWRMFMGTYKGATDIVTKHLWPLPAYYVTRWLAPRGVTPNMVTSVGAVLTVLAFLLFLWGDFGWGLLAAWAMTFFDTVDGKLARTTLTSSKWGDKFDHGIDLIHPPFWYIAWAVGLQKVGFIWSDDIFWWVIAIILGGYILQRLMEGAAIRLFRIHIHVWRRIDTLFRQVTARRNPNLVILTVFTLFGRPDAGLIAVAAWTLICLVLHAIQLAQALLAYRAAIASGKTLGSWLSQP